MAMLEAHGLIKTYGRRRVVDERIARHLTVTLPGAAFVT